MLNAAHSLYVYFRLSSISVLLDISGILLSGLNGVQQGIWSSKVVEVGFDHAYADTNLSRLLLGNLAFA